MKQTWWISILLVLITPITSIGQGFQTEWEKQFGGQVFNSFADVVENSNGTYSVLGSVDRQGTAACELWLIHFSYQGDTLGSQRFSNEGMDYPVRLAKFPDNGYLLAALNGAAGGSQTPWIIRTDQTGNELWRKSFPEATTTGRTDIAINDAGTIWWLNTVSDEKATSVARVSQLNDAGEILNTFTIKENQEIHAHAIRVLPDNSLAISGQTDLGKGTSAMWVMRLDPGGEVIWKSTIPGTGRKISPECICCTPDNNIVIAGWIGSCMNPDAAPADQIFDFDLMLTKIDNKGKIVWTKNYDREGSEGGNAVAIQPDGNILVAGKCETSFSGTIGPWILNIDKTGKKITDQVDRFRFSGDQASRIINTADGGFLMVGPGTINPEYRRSNGWIKKFIQVP
jgi:hypothetical protein